MRWRIYDFEAGVLPRLFYFHGKESLGGVQGDLFNGPPCRVKREARGQRPGASLIDNLITYLIIFLITYLITGLEKCRIIKAFEVLAP